MEHAKLTYDEIWHHLTVAKNLATRTNDTLTSSSLPILATALARAAPNPSDTPITLTELETHAVNNIQAMREAYVTLYLTEP
ncbi:MAG: hypothetical protein A2Y38_14655 [Spirochaetes bacterium GWB1_59_5]|nr:MAG: hypothetical protein A2Y38_14655 [Spirochaetes bacterium GWB1_59_5]